MQKRKNIYLDPDTADFLDNKYVGNNPSYLINQLLRAFEIQYNQVTDKQMFSNAADCAIRMIKLEKEE